MIHQFYGQLCSQEMIAVIVAMLSYCDVAFPLFRPASLQTQSINTHTHTYSFIYFRTCCIFLAAQAFSPAMRGSWLLWVPFLQSTASTAQAQWLWRWGCVAPRHVGILPDQGLSSCLLHSQVESLPLNLPWSPQASFFKVGTHIKLTMTSSVCFFYFSVFS